MSESNEPPSKKRRVHKVFSFDATYPDKRSAVTALSEEACWSYYYKNDSEKGTRVSYRCNSVKFRSKKQCEAAVYLLYHSHSCEVSLFRSSSAHSHEDEDTETAFQFTPAAIELVTEEYNRNTKPKGIKAALVLKGHPAPPATKLASFLKKLRATKFGKDKLHLGTLESWLLEKLTAPENEQEPFIINFEIDSFEDDPRFRLVMLQLVDI